MFFQFTPDAETLRRMQEEAARKAEESQATGPKMYQASDGSIVIDDPSLVTAKEVLDDRPSLESLQLTSMWVPNVFSADGSLGAWVPLVNIPWWRDEAAQ